MSSILILALAQAANALPAPPAAETWSALPFVPVNGLTIDDAATIMRLAAHQPECRAGIRPMPDQMERLDMDLALLIAPDGRLLRAIAAAGSCDAIRTQAQALIRLRYVSGSRRPDGPAPAWYRTHLGISWSQ